MTLLYKGIEGYSKAKVKHMIYDHYQKIWTIKKTAQGEGDVDGCIYLGG